MVDSLSQKTAPAALPQKPAYLSRQHQTLLGTSTMSREPLFLASTIQEGGVDQGPSICPRWNCCCQDETCQQVVAAILNQLRYHLKPAPTSLDLVI